MINLRQLWRAPNKPRRQHHRGNPRRSLSNRLLRLTVGLTLTVGVMILLPSLGLERTAWFEYRLREAHLAALTVAAAPDGMINLWTRNELLRLSGTEAIELRTPNGRKIVVMPSPRLYDNSGAVRLGDETLFTSTLRALQVLIGEAPTNQLVIAPSPLQQDATVRMVVSTQALCRDLLRHAEHIAALSLALALVIGLALYLSLDRLLVLPMRRLTRSIAEFRADPEHVVPLAHEETDRATADEISVAARELATMQTELRAALWRNARLAALGTAVAKIGHDLRNILASALLIADRLVDSKDPATQRAAGTLVAAVERATELMTATLEFAREGPPPLLRSPCKLQLLLDEVTEQVQPLVGDFSLITDIPAGLTPKLDRGQFYRVLFNLLRNAVEAGANKVSVSARMEAGTLILDVTDNGPGLPDQARSNLFRPFVGSGRRGGTGLGLAIARDLTRAHGGELELIATSSIGTKFRITIPEEG